MKYSKTLIGGFFIFSSAVLWSLFPIFSKLVLADIPLFFTMGLCWLFAGILFVFLLRKTEIFKEWKNSTKKKEIIGAGIILGIFLHSFIFLAMKYTTAGNMMILGTSEMFYSFLFFHFIKKEKETFFQFLGAGIMMIGIFIIFYPQILSFSFNWGDILVLGGMALAPLGNSLQKKAMEGGHSSVFILFFRTLLTAPFFFVLSFLLQENISADIEIWEYALPLILFIGVGILGLSKICWLEGIKRLSIPKATSLALIEPLLTIVFAYIILFEVPQIYQIYALPVMILGAYFLVIYKSK